MKKREFAALCLCGFAGGAVATFALRALGVNDVNAEGAAAKNVITAEEVRLVDAKGAVRAKLGLDDKGVPNLWLTSASGKTMPQLENIEDTAATLEKVEPMRKFIKEISDRKEKDAETVKVQHILIAFAGTGTRATRSKKEAEALTADVWKLVKDGENFDDLVKKYSDDTGGGTYTMIMKGTANPGAGVYLRTGMVKAFGNVGWRLDVGEVGISDHDAVTSPFGYHIIKRLK